MDHVVTFRVKDNLLPHLDRLVEESYANGRSEFIRWLLIREIERNRVSNKYIDKTAIPYQEDCD